MTVYIHEPVTYPHDFNAFTQRRKGDTIAAHMATDGEVSELIKFAVQIGLDPMWLQGKSRRDYHFDVLGWRKYREAVAYGAKVVSASELARRCWMPHIEARKGGA